ncbi:baseplate wedge subunit [uncultured Caudovirales phage]|uniref:Baseplate wedge subunit n=1 Tax=uncultured Caudovirales phage TaxID=2100421 RepID=A0A6J5KV83_9CAUD|nr:baseplate wedge subunit [uncultured Caudovirales phage]
MATKLSVADLDFDVIKTNLKTYLRSQSQFSDYDFEGAGINILLDILAYNTHYNSFYLNMVANEMFLDSSSLRQSTVSHAKLLGYTPRSSTAAVATVNVSVTRAVSDTITTSLTLPRFTTFTSQSTDGISYTFVANTSHFASNVGNSFAFTGVEIKEGTLASYIFPVDNTTNPKQIFELPDSSIDTSTLQIIVQKSSTELQQNTYTLATDATEVATTSQVYYLEEGDSGKYRIYFGDDLYGRKLSDGNLVAVSYISTSGDLANGLNKFKMIQSVLAGSTSSVTTAINSAGGSSAEMIDDIKFSATKSFISNNRAVTKNDYITLINKKYPYFDAVNVWGGEEEVPPVYGKVYIAVKPKLGYEVTQTEKEYIVNDIIKPISVMTVTPEIVDVNYNYLMLTINVQYDPRETSFTASQIQTIVKNAIAYFSVDTLNQFTSSFKLSKLLYAVDNSDQSISSSVADVFIQKRLSPILNSQETYTLKFETELHRGSSASDKIYSSPAFFQTDSSGISRNVYLEETPESFSGIEYVSITDSGSNYTKTPTVIINGDGTDAVLKAIIVNGQLKSVEVVNPGVGYSSASLTIQNAVGDTTGVSAKAVASIHGKTGVVRSYYYDNNGVKKILDSTAGTIDYINGIVKLVDFAPEDINSSIKTLKIFAKPNVLSFKSSRQTIVTLDTFDPASIVVNVTAVS